MNSAEQKFASARKAIIALFSDTSVNLEVTKEYLLSLQEDIDTMLESINTDLQNWKESDDET
jgi:hypothetical protein